MGARNALADGSAQLLVHHHEGRKLVDGGLRISVRGRVRPRPSAGLLNLCRDVFSAMSLEPGRSPPAYVPACTGPKRSGAAPRCKNKMLPGVVLHAPATQPARIDIQAKHPTATRRSQRTRETRGGAPCGIGLCSELAADALRRHTCAPERDALRRHTCRARRTLETRTAAKTRVSHQLDRSRSRTIPRRFRGASGLW